MRLLLRLVYDANTDMHFWRLQYYTQALNSPFGQKVRAFYTTTTKQVLDIHEEARRLAMDQQAATSAAAPASEPAT
jgi:hypothetical protein